MFKLCARFREFIGSSPCDEKNTSLFEQKLPRHTSELARTQDRDYRAKFVRELRSTRNHSYEEEHLHLRCPRLDTRFQAILPVRHEDLSPYGAPVHVQRSGVSSASTWEGDAELFPVLEHEFPFTLHRLLVPRLQNEYGGCNRGAILYGYKRLSIFLQIDEEIGKLLHRSRFSSIQTAT